MMQINIPTLHRAMNSKRAMVVVFKMRAADEHRAKRFKAWSYYMNKLKQFKRELAILAYWLHQLLVARGLTRVSIPKPASTCTARDLFSVIWPDKARFTYQAD